MSVSNETNRIAYTAAGGETEFDFTNILVFSGIDLKIYLNGTLLNSSAYTVTLSGTAPADGTVTLNTAVEADDIIIIERDILLTQPTVYNPGTAFPAKSHENALDRRALSDNDLALEARYIPKFNRGYEENIDWAYTNMPDDETASIPVYDPSTKLVSWTDASVLNEEGGTPATVTFGSITGSLDISGADARIEDITLPYGGAVPLNLLERWQNWYTVKDFGAVGDGVEDDSQAFTDCEAAGGLGWVYVPSGTYKLSSSVTVTNVIIATGATVEPDSGMTFTVTGAIVTGFDQIFDGDGSVAITTQRPIYTEWFGAVADGATDNIVAFDKAVAACDNNTCSIQLLNGTYVIGSTWEISLEGAAIAGMGSSNSIIAANFTTGDDIVLTSNNPCFVGDLAIQPSVTKVSGNALVITAASENVKSEFVGLRVTNAYNGIHFLKASSWLVHHCAIEQPINAGIVVDNDNDTTDSSGKIDNTSITKTTTVGTGIYHVAGGNLIISNNVITGFAQQYYLIPDSGVTASNVSIVGNVLSNGTRGIWLDRTAGTGDWNYVNISSNNIINMATANIHIGDSVADWLANVVINGNLIGVANGATGVLVDDQDGILIDANVFNGISGTTVGTDTGANITSVDIGSANQYNNITTRQTNAASGNEARHYPQVFYGTAVWDPGSVAQADVVSTTVTVTGAVVGMFSLASLDTLDVDDVILSSFVSAADTVTVTLHNIANVAGVDLDEGNLNVVVFDPVGALGGL